jgi:hypothetical protein
MSFLILKAGLADDLFLMPIASGDHASMLSEFKSITIEGEDADWGKLTSSLRSLITTSLVLLAGHASERIKYGVSGEISPHSSTLAEKAWHLLGSYFEEYGEKDWEERHRQATRELEELFELADKELRARWASVDALANALLQSKTLSEGEAFQIVERYLLIGAP